MPMILLDDEAFGARLVEIRGDEPESYVVMLAGIAAKLAKTGDIEVAYQDFRRTSVVDKATKARIYRADRWVSELAA